MRRMLWCCGWVTSRLGGLEGPCAQTRLDGWLTRFDCARPLSQLTTPHLQNPRLTDTFDLVWLCALVGLEQPIFEGSTTWRDFWSSENKMNLNNLHWLLFPLIQNESKRDVAGAKSRQGWQHCWTVISETSGGGLVWAAWPWVFVATSCFCCCCCYHSWCCCCSEYVTAAVKVWLSFRPDPCPTNSGSTSQHQPVAGRL